VVLSRDSEGEVMAALWRRQDGAPEEGLCDEAKAVCHGVDLGGKAKAAGATTTSHGIGLQGQPPFGGGGGSS
jgi:hypothetical protein